MSSRFPPSNPSDSRFPRDRSPLRILDRRPSAAYNDGPPGPRTNSNDFYGYSGRGREPPREPPSGPKALRDAPRGSGFIPRGRGFLARGDGRERDAREFGPREEPFARRGGRGQEWGPRERFDGRDRRPSPSGRDRSRSPLSRDFRDTRDVRDFPPRDDRRDVREGPLPALSDAFPSRGRGGYRGRGRSDWDFNRRGRGSYPEERHDATPRSRSRDRDWERQMRDDRDREREFEANRREDDHRREREEREREDRFRREQPYRPDSRNSTGGQQTPITSRSTSVTSAPVANLDRFAQNSRDSRDSQLEQRTRPTSHIVDARRASNDMELDRGDPHLRRSDGDRYDQRTASPPPPPVPAFGSIPHRAPIHNQEALPKQDSPKDRSPLVHPSRLSLLEPSREPPSAPKAQVPNNAPSAPKAQQIQERWLSSETLEPNRRLPGHESRAFGLQRQSLPTSTNASARDFEEAPNTSKRFSDTSPIRAPFLSASAALDPTQPSIRKAVEEQGRNGNVEASAAGPVTTLRPPLGGSSTQGSPIKIPTGPRADRATPSIRQPAPPSIRAAPNRPPPMMQRGGGRGGAWSWVNPNPSLPKHTPRGPSIMNTVPTKRDHIGEEKGRTGPSSVESTEYTADKWRRENAPTGTSKARSTSEKSQDNDPRSLQEADRRGFGGGGEIKVEESDQGEPKPRMMGPEEYKEDDESDEAVAEDGEMDLDEQDFAQAEKKFDHEIQALEAKRPPTPRSNPVILELLEELDALAYALEEKVKEGAIDEESSATTGPLGLPSPKVDDAEEIDFKREIDSPPPRFKSRPQTPPVSSLPFLVSGPPTPFSDIEDLQEDLQRQQAVETLIVEELTRQREFLQSQDNVERQNYISTYKRWRMNIEDYEEQKRAEDPTAISPVPDSMPLSTPAPPVVGRRGKIISELDMQEVLKVSQETAAKEERARREQEAPVYVPPETFNPDREAIVPDMLSEYERVIFRYDDTNNLVDHEDVLEALNFLPRKDDFTPEEHETFLYNYLLFPKRFGAIAETLEGRDFRDCVQHYYLTKLLVKYKDQEAAFMKTKKGKKLAATARGQQIRPRAAGLISSVDGGMDYETQNIPLNEKGRPKRAAAPTFGDNADPDPATPAPTPARRGAAASKDANSNLSSEKSTAKRTRTVPAKEKGAKKGKAPLLAAAPGPSPQKSLPEAVRAISKESAVDNEQRVEEIEGAQVLAGLTSGQPYTAPAAQQPPTEGWSVDQSVPASIDQTPQQVQSFIQEQPPAPQQKSGVTTSSYWSVPEQCDFHNYLRYFGTDWQSIAKTMKTKTHIMVRSSVLERAAKSVNVFLDQEFLQSKDPGRRVRQAIGGRCCPCRPNESRRTRHGTHAKSNADWRQETLYLQRDEGYTTAVGSKYRRYRRREWISKFTADQNPAAIQAGASEVHYLGLCRARSGGGVFSDASTRS